MQYILAPTLDTVFGLPVIEYSFYMKKIFAFIFWLPANELRLSTVQPVPHVMRDRNTSVVNPCASPVLNSQAAIVFHTGSQTVLYNHSIAMKLLKK